MMYPTFRLGEKWPARRPGAGAAGTALVPHVLSIAHTHQEKQAKRAHSACIPNQYGVDLQHLCPGSGADPDHSSQTTPPPVASPAGSRCQPQHCDQTAD